MEKIGKNKYLKISGKNKRVENNSTLFAYRGLSSHRIDSVRGSEIPISKRKLFKEKQLTVTR